MTIPEIRTKARDIGVRTGKMNKAELIHAIQNSEGNLPCYGQANGQCPNSDCCFMQDCLKVNR